MSKILITGASGGFGALAVKALLKDGHDVTATMRNKETKNKSIAEELSGLGAHVVEIDVTNDESVVNGVNEAVDLMGGLDTVINNAGVGVLGIQENFTIEDFQRLFDINVFGVQRVNRAALPHLRAQGHGHLMHVSSILGRMALPFLGGYSVGLEVQNTVTISSYVGYLSMLTIPTGLIFQLPLLVYFLAKIGLITPQIMRAYRKHAIVVILILSAIITPPDPPTMFLISIPIFLLYEISIFIVARTTKKLEAEMNS